MGRLTERMALRDECDFHSPPFRLHLLRATSPNVGCHRLVLVLHHALYDGASIRTLLEYVEMVYRGIKPSAVVQFTELLPHFVFQERKGTLFWVQKLEDHVRTPLPRSKDVTGSVATTAFRDIYLDSANLSAVLDRAGASAQSLAQAAWAKLIASILNTQDIVFGHVVSGRSLPGAADVVGPVLVSHSALCSCVSHWLCFRIRYPVVYGSRKSGTLTSFERFNMTMLTPCHGNKRPLAQFSVNSGSKHYGTISSYSSQQRGMQTEMSCGNLRHTTGKRKQIHKYVLSAVLFNIRHIKLTKSYLV